MTASTVVSDGIRPKFDLIQAFMVVFVTRKKEVSALFSPPVCLDDI